MTMTQGLRARLRHALTRDRPDPPRSLIPVEAPRLLPDVNVECRTCSGDAEIQLFPELLEEPAKPHAEFLCFECLGTFLGTFADPRVLTWSVTRL